MIECKYQGVDCKVIAKFVFRGGHWCVIEIASEQFPLCVPMEHIEKDDEPRCWRISRKHETSQKKHCGETLLTRQEAERVCQRLNLRFLSTTHFPEKVDLTSEEKSV